MAKKANRAEWLAQKRVADAQKRLRPAVEKLPRALSAKQEMEKNAVVARGLREARRKKRLKRGRDKRARAAEEEAKRAERIALEVERQELESWRWSAPCSSPEPPISHTWRLLDERTWVPRIWWGGLLLRMAGCVNCGIKAEFSEGAWETTVAVGDGPCVKWAS